MTRLAEGIAFFHMPKTGGTWLNNVISCSGPCESIGRAHGCVRDFDPDRLAGRVVFGTVREACAWYASWWQHGTAYDHLSKQMERWGRGSTDFKDVLWCLTHPWDLDADELPDWPGIVWGPPPKNPVLQGALCDSITSGRQGFWSWAVEHLYGQPFEVDALVDTAQIREGAEEVLGYPIDAAKFPPRNTRWERKASAVEDARTLFTDEMFEWVRAADGPLLDLLGYREPFGKAPTPVLWNLRGRAP